MILEWGPCQPKEHELPNNEYPKDSSKRSFHSSWYSRKLLDSTFEQRNWLTYSPKLNKVFCLYCIIYGNNSNDAWVKYGFSHWKNGHMALIKHETTSAHIMASLKVKLKACSLPLLPSLVEEHNKQVTFNRELVKQLIEITIFLAQHNHSFRGHNENWKNNTKGNFKDMVVLLSKHSPILSVHIDQLKSKGKKTNSFISWDRQNLLIESISEYISSTIRSQILSSRYFSISTDSTFDISHKEQLSFVVRYLFNSKICERLIALSESSNTTGQSLFELFKSVMEKNGLDWSRNLIGQSYDGAANMRGSYSGLQAHIIKENPKALYVWCHAHRFNLIVLSAVGCCKEAVDLFGNMEKLYSFIVGSKKRSDIYRKNQIELYPKKQLKAIKRVGTTRWMSNSFALSTVLETLEAILDMLEQVKNVEGPADFKTGSECNGLQSYFQSSRFILTAFIFKHIFEVMEPLSKILQSRDLDLLTAVDYLKKVEQKITMMRTDEKFNTIFEEAKQFSEEHFGDFNMNNLMSFRNRKRNVVRRSGELCVDQSIQDSKQYYKISVFFLVIDIILQQLNDRFDKNTLSVMKDIGLLSIKRIKEVGPVPQDAFSKICDVYGINQERVRNDYILLKSIIKDLDLNLLTKLPAKLHDDYEELLSDSNESNDEDEEQQNLNNFGSLGNIFEIINTMNIKSEFEHLYTIIKISLTLPTSSCTVERSFSKLKIIKSRLRSTMDQNRLENLMIISCEQDINIDVSKVNI